MSQVTLMNQPPERFRGISIHFMNAGQVKQTLTVYMHPSSVSISEFYSSLRTHYASFLPPRFRLAPRSQFTLEEIPTNLRLNQMILPRLVSLNQSPDQKLNLDAVIRRSKKKLVLRTKLFFTNEIF